MLIKILKQKLAKIYNKGFTLIELLVVITIIGILAAMILITLNRVKEKAYDAKGKMELQKIAEAVGFYVDDHNGTYPDDVNRNIPAELQPYLAANYWPPAAWPESVFDWDNWEPANLVGPPYEQIYQISIRFCPYGDPNINHCHFPKESWAQNFGVDSAVYYCISGPCRSHSSHPMDYPGYCINC